VQRVIQLDFRRTVELAGDGEEIYEVTINRQRPRGEGTDRVTTWFRDIETLVPVRVRDLGTYRYQIHEIEEE
jgi:hypothetical protein